VDLEEDQSSKQEFDDFLADTSMTVEQTQEEEEEAEEEEKPSVEILGDELEPELDEL
jgi:hypothetical protein